MAWRNDAEDGEFFMIRELLFCAIGKCRVVQRGMQRIVTWHGALLAWWFSCREAFPSSSFR